MSVHGMIVFIHVLAAAVLLGSSLLAPVLRGAIREARDLDGLRGSLALLRRASGANPVASLVVLASGLWLGTEGWWREGWFQVALVMFIASAVLAIRFVKRGGMEIGRAAATAGSGPVPPAIDELRRSSTWELAASALLVNDLVALLLMTTKPGLAGSIAAVVIGQIGLAAYHLARGKRTAANLQGA